MTTKQRTKTKVLIIAASIAFIVVSILTTVFIKKLLVQVDNSIQIEITSADKFLGRDNLLSEENADYHSYLLTRPECVTEDMEIEKYYYNEYQSINNLYTILLVYTLKDEAYKKEKQRLSELKLSYGGKEKEIIYIDGGTSDRDSYLAIYDEYGNYEYTLTDDTNHRIVCVFTQYMGYEKIPEEYQLKSFNLAKDLWESDKIAYNMYWFWEKNGNRNMAELN